MSLLLLAKDADTGVEVIEPFRESIRFVRACNPCLVELRLGVCPDLGEIIAKIDERC